MENTIPYQQAKERLRKITKQAMKEPPGILRRICGEFYQPYYHLMYLLSRQMTGGLLVELGVHIGRGLVSMGGNSNLIIGIDTHHHPLLDGIIAGHKNILFYHQASLPVPDGIIRWANDKNYNGINLLHIDTEHSYAMAKAEFEAYRPYLAEGAYVLFDDLHAMDNGVMKYFRELPYPKIWSDKLHPICGYGVMVYSPKEQET